MSRRLLFLIGAAVVLTGGAIALFIFVNRSPALQNTVLKLGNVNTANTNASTNTNIPAANTNTVVNSDQVARDYAARNFAEAFGSGSSEDNFSNQLKAKPFATDSFNAFLERSLAQQRQINLAGPFHSFLTKSLVATTTRVATTTASMTIGTQRQETIADETKTFYQDLLVDLVKISGNWKINAASWKPR